ncbi:MAG TPA: hypothetical protein VKA08_01725 [Balneolales bacterium]|nr:hypothetical protein [Balneolales bacterium]
MSKKKKSRDGYWALNYFKDGTARTKVLSFSIVYISISAIFWWAYPQPLFTGDTGSYILSAMTGQINGVRPIGYSWFLKWLHAIFPSIGFVIFMQYSLLAFALLFFYLTVDYLFKIQYPVSVGLAILLAFCPAQLYLATSFMSDAAFIIYTLFWLASLFWMIRRPGYPVFIVHLVLLFLAINTRYIGLFYPLITISVLVYSYRKKAWVPALVVIGMVFGIYRYTASQMKKYYGLYTFTEFSGWATANNASIMVPHIDLRLEHFTEKPLEFINRVMAAFPDSMYNPRSVLETQFIWNKRYPGKQILYRILKSNSRLSYTNAWVLVGKWYGKYGRTLILEHPVDFIHYFVLLNTKQVFYPEIGLGIFSHDSQMDRAALAYYGVDSSKFRARYDIFGKLINGITSPLNLLLWISFFALAGIWVWTKSWKNLATDNRNILFITIIFMAMYLGGSILTHPVHYRYLLPIHPLILMLCAVFLNDSLRLKGSA